jgi:hypothetical protein
MYIEVCVTIYLSCQQLCSSLIETESKENTTMAPKISQHQLLEDLQDDNSFFDALVDMIPAKLYVAGNSGDDFNPKYFKGNAKESKEARKAQAKLAKKAKLDPNLAETTTQTKHRLEGDCQIPGKPKALLANKPPSTSTTKDNQDSNAVIPTDNKSRIEALRAKLHAKLAEKRGSRPDPNVVSKRAARAAEKKRRREEAKRRKKMAPTSAEDGKNKKIKIASGKDVDPAQDLAQLDFGRLHGLNKSTTDNYQKQNKSLANLSKTKNLQKMLADAEAKRQKLEELKKSSKEEDKEKAANIQWGDLIKEASGDRVKDDPAKLKKAIKRKEAKKKKSAKAWKSRMDQTKLKMDERQKIRSHNLDKRKLGGASGANLSKKKIIEDDATGTKKKRNSLGRAGFEGRKQDFLNTPKKDQ